MVIQDVKIFTKEEILPKIEELKEPGETIFFYLSASPVQGGPLGKGAAVVELNPKYPENKQKKYILYIAPVNGMEPAGKGMKLFDSNKSKDLSSWIKERHRLPMQFTRNSF
jgi:hypothetical protein